ncbi:MAG: hypothetical protein E7011_01885, partial [Alphaproteobacteria bacterium]|nr:hypothetical protein [Alphaproteobacteria bacterium]
MLFFNHGLKSAVRAIFVAILVANPFVPAMAEWVDYPFVDCYSHCSWDGEISVDGVTLPLYRDCCCSGSYRGLRCYDGGLISCWRDSDCQGYDTISSTAGACISKYDLDTSEDLCGLDHNMAVLYFESCDEGEYLSEVSGSCKECPRGHWCSGSAITPCPVDTYNEEYGSSSPSACIAAEPGSTYDCNDYDAGCSYGTPASSSGGNLVTGCSSGTYYNNGNCVTCPAGYYCPGSSANYAAVACPAGTYNRYTGESSSLDCRSISSGYYGTGCAADGTACTAYESCPVGYYCPNGIKTACPAGTYNEFTGQSSSSRCKNISSGYYGAGCAADGTACTVVKTCPNGYYCTGGIKYACPSGYGSSAAGSSAASHCYTVCDKPCTQSGCRYGYSCTYNSSSTSGYQNYGGSCDAAASTCSIASQTCNTPCTSVANRETRSVSESCTRSCGISNGTCSYSGSTRINTDTCDGNYTSGGCKSAGESCSGCNVWIRTSTGTCSGGTISITCNAGYYLLNGTCVQCESGFYCTGNNTRTSCPSGYGSSAAGSDAASDCYTSCTKACTQQSCPSNATCTHGSTSTTGTQYYGGSCSASASTCS